MNLFLWLSSSFFFLSSFIKADLSSIVKENPIVIFSKTQCPWCSRAKELLKSKNIAFESVELDKLPPREAMNLFESLVSQTKQRTVPNIFINGEHVGGFDSISRLDADGELNNLVVKIKK